MRRTTTQAIILTRQLEYSALAPSTRRGRERGAQRRARQPLHLGRGIGEIESFQAGRTPPHFCFARRDAGCTTRRMPPLKLTFAVAPPALAFLVGQAAMQSASAQPAMDIPSVPTLYPTYTHQPTGPTFSPTKQPTLSPTCSGNKGKCIDNGTPYELGFALGMVGVLVSARVPLLPCLCQGASSVRPPQLPALAPVKTADNHSATHRRLPCPLTSAPSHTPCPPTTCTHAPNAHCHLLQCCIGILVSAIGRRFRGQKVDPETGLPAKRAPKGVPDKKSWARVVPQFPPIGPPPMPPPPMMPTDPPVKNIPMDVNTPFGWKRKQVWIWWFSLCASCHAILYHAIPSPYHGVPLTLLPPPNPRATRSLLPQCCRVNRLRRSASKSAGRSWQSTAWR